MMDSTGDGGAKELNGYPQGAPLQGASLETPTATVILPHVLRARIGNRKSVVVAGCTVREIIDALDADFPGLRFNLCYETGELRPYVNVFLERENIRYLQGLDTPVSTGATIYILQSVAGG